LPGGEVLFAEIGHEVGVQSTADALLPACGPDVELEENADRLLGRLAGRSLSRTLRFALAQRALAGG
jgi:hypothetical protein